MELIKTTTLLCLLLIGQHAHAVSNKQSTSKTEEIEDNIAAADRIRESVVPADTYGPPADTYGPPADTYGPPADTYGPPANTYGPPADTYGPPADTYGPPSNSGSNKPAPVYGPPELTGDYRPPQIFDPPPPELPPPVSGPSFSSYGPPRKTKPHFGPSKLSHGPPPPSFGPPKSQYGPPKSGFGPSRQSFKLPRPKYGAPFKTSSSQFGPPASSYGPPNSVRPPASDFELPAAEHPISQFGIPTGDYSPPRPQPGPPAPEYGLPNSISGPPAPEYGVPNSISGSPAPEYGPPKPISGPPAPEYGPPRPISGPPAPEYGPPRPISGPPAPEYGVPNSISGPPAPEYGPPRPQSGPPASEYGPPRPQSGPPAPAYGPPSAQYGPPDNQYNIAPLPESSLPNSIEEYGPPRGNFASSFTSKPNSQYGAPQPISSSQYRQPADIFGPPPSPPAGVPAPPTPPEIKYDGWQPIQGHINSPNQQLPRIPEQPPPDTYGPPTANLVQAPLTEPLAPLVSGNGNIPSDSYGVPLNNPDHHQLKNSVNPNDGLPPQPLPQYEPFHNIQGPAKPSDFSGNSIENHPQPTFSVPTINSQGNQLGAPQSFGKPSSIYGQPPSFNNDLSFQKLPQNYGPPPRGGSFSSANTFNIHFPKNGLNRNRNTNGYKSPINNNFVPPRRAPMKFRDLIPAGMFSALHKYLPPLKNPFRNFGTPPQMHTEQQLPTLITPNVFHGPSNDFSSAGNVHNFNTNSALAAPNVNYGTPLSFADFNTPAPGLTYGTPNFVPPAPIGDQRNLYAGLPQIAYGTPFASPGRDCQPNTASIQFQADHSAANSLDIRNGNLNADYIPPTANSISNFQGGNYALPSNNIDTPADNYGAPDQSQTVVAAQPVAKENVAASNQVQTTYSLSSNNVGLSTEELTAALTAQGFGEPKNIVSSQEVDPKQFLNSKEGNEVMQLLTNDGDGFQIQGSQGVYKLEIQPANGEFGTTGSDGNIRHEQVLSNGLLQNILAAIEQQPEGGQIQIDGGNQLQVLEQVQNNNLNNVAPQNQNEQVNQNFNKDYSSQNLELSSIDENNLALLLNQSGYGEKISSQNSGSKHEAHQSTNNEGYSKN